jgi:hypothetical protein
MAKRVPLQQEEFNPVQETLTRSVLRPEVDVNGTTGAVQQGALAPAPAAAHPKVVSIDGGRKGEPQEQPKEPKEVKRLSKVARFLLTDEENATLDQLSVDMARRLGTSLTVSHVLRATTTLLVNSRDELLKQSEKMGPLKRPSNNDPAALASFEHNLTRLIDRAVRNSKLLE